MILYSLYIGIYMAVYLLVAGCNLVTSLDPFNCRAAGIFVVLISAIGFCLYAEFGPFPLRTELINISPRAAPSIDPGIYLHPALQLAVLVGLYELYIRWKPARK